jgi:hypothetical protein
MFSLDKQLARHRRQHKHTSAGNMYYIAAVPPPAVPLYCRELEPQLLVESEPVELSALPVWSQLSRQARYNRTRGMAFSKDVVVFKVHPQPASLTHTNFHTSFALLA